MPVDAGAAGGGWPQASMVLLTESENLIASFEFHCECSYFSSGTWCRPEHIRISACFWSGVSEGKAEHFYMMCCRHVTEITVKPLLESYNRQIGNVWGVCVNSPKVSNNIFYNLYSPACIIWELYGFVPLIVTPGVSVHKDTDNTSIHPNPVPFILQRVAGNLKPIPGNREPCIFSNV